MLIYFKYIIIIANILPFIYTYDSIFNIFTMQKLSVKGLAVAFGVITAFFMLFISWAAMFGWGGEMVDLMST